MGNHYHLFLETPEANLVAGMKWLQITVARRFNIRHGKWGHLFEDRYKAILVDGRQPYYYETLLDYIHLNPARAHLIAAEKGESIRDYRWSSLAGGYALPPGKRAKWFSAAAGLEVMGLKDSTSGRREMVERYWWAATRGKSCWRNWLGKRRPFPKAGLPGDRSWGARPMSAKPSAGSRGRPSKKCCLPSSRNSFGRREVDTQSSLVFLTCVNI
jgi:hypothetical protein